VISDLDITRHTSKAQRAPGEFGPGAAQVFEGSSPNDFFTPVASRSSGRGAGPGSNLSPAEARAYMEQIAHQLQRSSQLVTEALSDRVKPFGQGN